MEDTQTDLQVERVEQVDSLQARQGAGVGGYLVRTYSLASCSTLPLAAGDIRDSE